MTRIATLLLLVLLWSAAAEAVVYQCRDKKGNIFLTNNRNKFPPGCVQFGEPMGEESAPSPPAAIPPAVPRSESEMRDRRRPSAPPRSQAPPAPREEPAPVTPSAEAAAPAGDAEIAPAGTPEAGAGEALPGQPGEPPPQDDQVDGQPADIPNAPGQPARPAVDTPVEAR